MMQALLFAMVQWGFLTAAIASSKNRNAAAWFGIGAALPLIGLVMVIVANKQPRQITAAA